MAGQGSYCCTTQRALCFWCATFLVLYGGGLLLFSVRCFRHELLLSRPYLLLIKSLRQYFYNRRSRQRQNLM